MCKTTAFHCISASSSADFFVSHRISGGVGVKLPMMREAPAFWQISDLRGRETPLISCFPYCLASWGRAANQSYCSNQAELYPSPRELTLLSQEGMGEEGAEKAQLLRAAALFLPRPTGMAVLLLPRSCNQCSQPLVIFYS